MGRSVAPKGFYTAAQAVKKLSLPRSTFYDMVERGQIKKVTPPNQTDGFYPKANIDKMAREKELFILTYAQDSSELVQAEEKDVMGIYEVCTSLWSERTPAYEARLSSYKQNPSIYYVGKAENIVVSFLGGIPFNQNVLDELMSAPQTNFYLTYQKVLEQEGSIQPFKPGEDVDSLFIDLAVKKGVPRAEQYGMRLLLGYLHMLDDLADTGIIVKKFHATSSSPDGIGLSRRMGFTELPPLKDTTRLRFELDLETSKNPQLAEYQKRIAEIKRRRTKNK